VLLTSAAAGDTDRGRTCPWRPLGKAETHVHPDPCTSGAPEGAAMRRDLVAVTVGTAVAWAGTAWYVLVERQAVTDVRLGGVPLQRVALGAIVAGLIASVGGLVVSRQDRRAAALAVEALEAERLEAEALANVWPTIVVRRHGRPRRQSAQVITLPPPVRSLPSPQHPSMVAGAGALTPPPLPTSVGDGWLPDNVQRLPYRL
jgi:hypothetical protein